MLMCTDGSKYAEGAIRFGSLIADAIDGQVTVLAVLEDPTLQEELQSSLETARDILTEHQITPETKWREGDARAEIEAEAKEGEYGLVVIGSLGTGTLTRALLGSTAAKLVANVDCPVLITRQERQNLERILICTGGYKYAEEAIQLSASLAQATGAEVTILHVASPVPTMYAGLDEMDQDLEEMLQTDTREAKYLKRAAEILEELEVEGNLKLRRGTVTEEIFAEAREGDFDLIALGSSHARSPVRAALMGDVTEEVVTHAQRPVLVVRPKEEKMPNRLSERFRFTRQDAEEW